MSIKIFNPGDRVIVWKATSKLREEMNFDRQDYPVVGETGTIKEEFDSFNAINKRYVIDWDKHTGDGGNLIRSWMIKLLGQDWDN